MGFKWHYLSVLVLAGAGMVGCTTPQPQTGVTKSPPFNPSASGSQPPNGPSFPTTSTQQSQSTAAPSPYGYNPNPGGVAQGNNSSNPGGAVPGQSAFGTGNYQPASNTQNAFATGNVNSSPPGLVSPTVGGSSPVVPPLPQSQSFLPTSGGMIQNTALPPGGAAPFNVPPPNVPPPAGFRN